MHKKFTSAFGFYALLLSAAMYPALNSSAQTTAPAATATAPAATTTAPTLLQERDYRALRIAANNLTKEQIAELRENGVAGDNHAQVVLGMAYQLGCPGAKNDAVEALKWYHMAADQGNSIAATQIAVYYDPSENFAGKHGSDQEQALVWYRKAAERGNDLVAQYNLAAMLWQMHRRDEALEWYRKAIANGSSLAAVSLVELYDQGLVLDGKSKHENWKTGASYFEELVSKGNPGAEYVMAMGHQQGWLGLHKDPTLAFELYRKAAAQGWTRAILAVGDGYYKGEGVRQDKAEAFKWLKQATDQGDPIGASYMAWMYERGEVVQKDIVEAYAWDVVATLHHKGIKFRESLSPDEKSRADKRVREILAKWGEVSY
jgi:TPR repeat protein